MAKSVEQKIIEHGVKQIIGAYNEAVDAYVTDEATRAKIKMSAGMGIMKKMLTLLSDPDALLKIVEEEDVTAANDKTGEQPAGNLFGGIDSWLNGKF